MNQPPAFGRGAVPISEIPAALGGRTAMPTAPVEVYGPQGQVMLLVCGFGVTEAAEIEEIAQEAVERQAERPDLIDDLRYRAGLPDHDQVDGLIRQALLDRAVAQRREPSRFVRPAPDRSWMNHLPELTLTDDEWDQAYELARQLQPFWPKGS